ncbi:MAG: TonB family protein [Mucilaginibacter polytrichastri]|nr:TonB family protein [Mucilaginibacter polytrichastri]
MKKFLSILLIPLFGGFTLQDPHPEFRGGARALNSFLADHLIYPEYSKQNCLDGTVQVGFHLDREGKVTDAKVQRGFGTDLDDEALRIVQLTSGRWTVPANYDPATPIILPVTFQNPQGYRCTGVSREDRQKAIAAYQSRQGLEEAVTNYYKNRSGSKADTAKESQIDALKTQLGINDEYISGLLKQAQKKIKQGDIKSACEDLNYIKNLGSTKADKLLAQYCK